MGEASMRKWLRVARAAITEQRRPAQEATTRALGKPVPVPLPIMEREIRATALHLRLRERRRRAFLRTPAGMWLSSPDPMIKQALFPVVFSGLEGAGA